MTNKIIGTIAVLALVIGASALYFVWPFISPVANSFGAVGVKLAENYDPYIRYNGGYNSALPIQTTGTFQVGVNGNSINQISFGACTIWTGATTIAATSSQQIVCQGATNGTIAAIANIPANSNCDLVAASSTSILSGGLVISGVSASSTAGTIVANLSNFTGTTFTWSATASSSAKWDYQCFI